MPRRSFRAVAAPMILLALIVAACGTSAASADPTDDPAVSTPAATADAGNGGNDDPTAAVPTPGTALNACEIVTSDDVRSALSIEADVDIAAGELKATGTSLSPGRSECTYKAGDSGSAGRVIVSLTPEDGPNLYDAARGAYDDAVDITGTGADGAFISAAQKRAFVWKGAVAVMLTVFPFGGAVSYGQAEAFAIAIVDKL